MNPAPGEAPPPAPSRRASAPLTPPRPALGGERGQPPFLRPSAPGGGTARSRPTSRSTVRRLWRRRRASAARRAARAAMARSRRLRLSGRRAPPRRPPALDPMPAARSRRLWRASRTSRRRRRGSAARARGARPARRGRSRRGLRGRRRRRRQRASARDYQSAYREAEMPLPRTSAAPAGRGCCCWPLLAAALVTGGVVWYYNTNIKNVAGTGAASGDVRSSPRRQIPPRSLPKPPAGDAARNPPQEEADL